MTNKNNIQVPIEEIFDLLTDKDKKSVISFIKRLAAENPRKKIPKLTLVASNALKFK